MALVRALMVVTYYIKLFHTEADRHNGIFNVSSPPSPRDNYKYVLNYFFTQAWTKIYFVILANYEIRPRIMSQKHQNILKFFLDNLRVNYNIKEADDQNIKFYWNQVKRYGK